MIDFRPQIQSPTKMKKINKPFDAFNARESTEDASLEKSSFLRLPFSSNLFFTLLWKVASAETSREPRLQFTPENEFPRKRCSQPPLGSYCASLPGGISFVARFRKEVFVRQTKSACSLKRRLISDGEKANSSRRRNMDSDKRERSPLEGLIRKLDREAEFGRNVHRVWWCLICYSGEAHI